jgi:hypothetical protein
MRALLAQWRMDVRWCRGGFPPTGVVPPLLLVLPGGVSGSTPPLMAPALRYSAGDERESTGKRKHFRNNSGRKFFCVGYGRSSLCARRTVRTGGESEISVIQLFQSAEVSSIYCNEIEGAWNTMNANSRNDFFLGKKNTRAAI